MELVNKDKFFNYLETREQIRLNKEAGLASPWSDDEILNTYKFTNVRRWNDRTSRFLIDNFYDEKVVGENTSIEDVLLSCVIFRYFGTAEFAEAIGWQTVDEFDPERIKQIASDRLDNNERVFTGAYNIPNQGLEDPKQNVVIDITVKGVIDKMDNLAGVVTNTDSWRDLVSEFKENCLGFGDFMSKEVVLDTMYCTGFWNCDDAIFLRSVPSDYWEWTPIGPGALRGANRVIGIDDGSQANYDTAFDVIMRLYEQHKERKISCIIGTLSPTDIQFGLCEFDKYERVRLDQGRPRSRYKPPVPEQKMLF